ncbi:MAG TPA: biotin/lipoyl-binding protein [Candidatus Atribacteria bacterium]|nr:biotin/lipoyl-binding protein [Candidatus Atribacteria bacterium]HPT78005.1 biotin/lipoyl-binding protein [Candidatus Atribacteria bacterium]
MRYIVTINNKTYEVEVEQGQASIINAGNAAVQASSQAAPATSQQAAPAPQPAPTAPQQAVQPAPAPAAVNGEAVKAPMPGTILDIRVSNGQAVKRGDVLFILEAMKMENEIMAPVDGVVQIVASKGATVNTGDILASIVNAGNVAVQASSQAAPATSQQAAPAPQPAPTAPQQAVQPAPAPAAVNGEAVKAPMPGTILDIRVSNGQAVKRGDVLFILEAMKMENEIMAPVDGVVQVVASKGATVNTGDILASIQ